MSKRLVSSRDEPLSHGRSAVGMTLLLAGLLLSASTGLSEDFQQDSTQSAGPAEDYRIGPRDVLEIRVFDLEQLDSRVRVSEVGTISLPLIGELEAAGLTRGALEAAIEQALSRFVNNPQVFVVVSEFQSQHYSILGAVRSPGTFQMVGNVKLLEALARVGGPDFDSAAGSVIILREGSANDAIEIELRQIFEDANPAFNIDLQPGDIINVVPRRSYSIYVYGQVRNPGSYRLNEPTTLLKAISMSGGLSPRAAAGRIRILRRKPDGTQEVVKVNLEEIEEGEKPDVSVLPDDIILVPETFF